MKTLDIRVVIHDSRDHEINIAKICIAILTLLEHPDTEKTLKKLDHVKTRVTVYDDFQQN